MELLHHIYNNTSSMSVNQVACFYRCHYSNNKTGCSSVVYIDAEHLEVLKKYKSPLHAIRFAERHKLAVDSYLEKTYRQYINTPYEPSCPSSAPVAVTSGEQGRGISNPVTSCPCPPETNVNSAEAFNTLVDEDASFEQLEILFCDVETTGLGDDDEVCGIAVVDIDENVVFESYVKPSKPISKDAINIHGITDDMVSNAPTFDQVFSNLQSILSNKRVVFYNAEFDERLIMQSLHGDFKPFGFSIFYLMEYYADFWGEYSDYFCGHAYQSLLNACSQQLISFDNLPERKSIFNALLIARLYKRLFLFGAYYRYCPDCGCKALYDENNGFVFCPCLARCDTCGSDEHVFETKSGHLICEDCHKGYLTV